MAGEEPVDPLIGAQVGPCRITQRLAAGGMGVVYRAQHSQLGHDVAVKILAPSLAQDQEYVTRFFREAGAAGQIDHPNVVRVIDVGAPLLAEETRLEFIRRYAEDSGKRLDELRARGQSWWEEEVRFFDVERTRAWRAAGERCADGLRLSRPR